MAPRLASFAFIALLAISSSLVCKSSAAQQDREIPRSPDKPYTLHVYEDLIQLPSFVLTQLHGTYRGLHPKDFNLRLDSGPVFHPLHVRSQGDDQMTLAVLLDDIGERGLDLQQELNGYATQMPPEVLQQGDTLSVFAARCGRVVSLNVVHASAAKLQAGVASVLSHFLAPEQQCPSRMPLWDVLGTAAMRLHEAAGRRVILVISDGTDVNSVNTWERLREYANHYSIAIIGIRLHALNPSPVMQPGKTRKSVQEDPFSMLCSGTGGILLDADIETVWPQFRRAMELLRERYILDFQRPVNDSAGLHLIDLTVTDKKAIVRISGIGVPLRDSNLLADPSTVPNDNSQAPIVGTRKILSKPN